MLIYVASPYSLGDTEANVRRACLAGDEILRKGHTPFVPHLTHLWHKISPKSYYTWLEIDRVILRRCDALVRLKGKSEGADSEVKEAKRLGIPVYFSLKKVPKNSDKTQMS